MPRRCVVIGCSTKSSSNNKSFYRFPSDEELCKKWLKALCNLQLVKIYETAGFKHLNKNKFVCSDHFEDKHLRNVKAPSQGLFDGAVPSININVNMDALISSLKQSDILHEITKPKIVKKKKDCAIGKTDKVIEKPEENKSVDSKKVSADEKKTHVTTPETQQKAKISYDDIPLKDLFQRNIKAQQTDQNKDKKENKQKKIKVKHTKTNCHKQKKLKKHLSSLNHIEQVFLPSDELKSVEQIKFNEKLLITHIKKETIDEVCDPLETIAKSLGFAKARHKKRKRERKMKKANKKKRNEIRKVIKKKSIEANSVKKVFKVVVDPKAIDSEQIKLSTQGPKKIIKVVVPPKSVHGNSEGQNKIIKVVVPKKTVNGKEINLEKDEINKILKLVATPKQFDGNAITQSSMNNEILKLVAVSKDVQSKPTEIRCNVNCAENVKNVEANNSYDGSKTISVAKGGKILKKVPPPKNVCGKEIKLITTNSENNKIFKVIPVPKNFDNNKLNINEQSIDTVINSNNDCEPHTHADNLVPNSVTNVQPIEDSVEILDSIDYLDSFYSSSDIPNESSINTDNLEKSVNVSQSNDKNLEECSNAVTFPPRKVDTVEVNPMTEELCKRIQFMIGQRFGENNDSSDSDSGEMNIPLIHIKKPPQKSIKQIMETYRGETNCSCNTIYNEKIKNLFEEEKNLKRQLKNVQKYVFHYKDNIKKRTALISELRKQIPVKKPQKTGQLIKTIIPLDKIKEKNPGTYRFTKSLKTFALDLFYSSPLSYNILEKMYFLPSRKTLKNWLTNPKNTSTDLIEDSNTLQDNLESIEDNNVNVIPDHNMDSTMTHSDILYHQQANHMSGLEHMDTNIPSIVDHMEPLHENIDDIMFRNDLTAAIMNT